MTSYSDDDDDDDDDDDHEINDDILCVEHTGVRVITGIAILLNYGIKRLQCNLHWFIERQNSRIYLQVIYTTSTLVAVVVVLPPTTNLSVKHSQPGLQNGPTPQRVVSKCLPRPLVADTSTLLIKRIRWPKEL
uniref:Uncharacterized protein n=1 Tax=Glossina austeni TaxID=7395 RepID=A0A1A9VMK5_GLOAU